MTKTKKANQLGNICSVELKALMELSSLKLESTGVALGVTPQAIHYAVKNPQRESARALHEFLTQEARSQGWVLTRVESG
jgi:hypothetical protein